MNPTDSTSLPKDVDIHPLYGVDLGEIDDKSNAALHTPAAEEPPPPPPPLDEMESLQDLPASGILISLAKSDSTPSPKTFLPTDGNQLEFPHIFSDAASDTAAHDVESSTSQEVDLDVPPPPPAEDMPDLHTVDLKPTIATIPPKSEFANVRGSQSQIDKDRLEREGGLHDKLRGLNNLAKEFNSEVAEGEKNRSFPLFEGLKNIVNGLVRFAVGVSGFLSGAFEALAVFAGRAAPKANLAALGTIAVSTANDEVGKGVTKNLNDIKTTLKQAHPDDLWMLSIALNTQISRATSGVSRTAIESNYSQVLQGDDKTLNKEISNKNADAEKAHITKQNNQLMNLKDQCVSARIALKKIDNDSKMPETTKVELQEVQRKVLSKVLTDLVEVYKKDVQFVRDNAVPGSETQKECDALLKSFDQVTTNSKEVLQQVKTDLNAVTLRKMPTLTETVNKATADMRAVVDKAFKQLEALGLPDDQLKAERKAIMQVKYARAKQLRLPNLIEGKLDEVIKDFKNPDESRRFTADAHIAKTAGVSSDATEISKLGNPEPRFLQARNRILYYLPLLQGSVPLDTLKQMKIDAFTRLIASYDPSDLENGSTKFRIEVERMKTTVATLKAEITAVTFEEPAKKLSETTAGSGGAGPLSAPTVASPSVQSAPVKMAAAETVAQLQTPEYDAFVKQLGENAKDVNIVREAFGRLTSQEALTITLQALKAEVKGLTPSGIALRFSNINTRLLNAFMNKLMGKQLDDALKDIIPKPEDVEKNKKDETYLSQQAGQVIAKTKSVIENLSEEDKKLFKELCTGLEKTHRDQTNRKSVANDDEISAKVASSTFLGLVSPYLIGKDVASKTNRYPPLVLTIQKKTNTDVELGRFLQNIG